MILIDRTTKRVHVIDEAIFVENAGECWCVWWRL